MPFAPEKVSYNETRKRTGDNYVKFSTDYRVVLRILDPEARLVWKHFIREANGGRGMGAVCPNTNSQVGACPIETDLRERGVPRDSEEYRDRVAKKRYIVNVLDRTPYTVCGSCGANTPGKKCKDCGTDLKKNDFAPLNKVKILEGGPQLFVQTLNAVDKMQQEESGLEITDYDITFSATGQGRDRKIAAIPGAASKITDEDMVDRETGEPQQLFNLDTLAEPNPVEEIELMLQGATMQDLNQIRGIE